jgi:quercetin dioxygenase-like cupin family protein
MTMPTEPRWIKLPDVEATVPPLHTNTYSWPLITSDTIGCDSISLFVSEIQPGGYAEMDRHPKFDQFFFVLSGRGKAIVNGKEFLMEPNGCLFIPKNAAHAMEVIGKETLRTIVICSTPAD